MTRRVAGPALGAALALASAHAAAQNEDVYRPLFTPEMIEKAAPAQAERMRDAEELNRRTFEKRREARQREEEAKQAASAPPPPPPRRSKKIYKWVDENGRVHFGDAPQGNDAQVVDVRGSSSNPRPEKERPEKD